MLEIVEVSVAVIDDVCVDDDVSEDVEEPVGVSVNDALEDGLLVAVFVKVPDDEGVRDDEYVADPLPLGV